jgi:hypothetical protein
MSDLLHAAHKVSHRTFLAVGTIITAAVGTLGSWVYPLSVLGLDVPATWPTAPLSAADAGSVNESQFMPVEQFRQWHDALEQIGPANQKGLRATGSPEHESYIDALKADLKRAGVKELKVDKVPMDRWTTIEWSLDILDGPSAGPVKTSSYIP